MNTKKFLQSLLFTVGLSTLLVGCGATDRKYGYTLPCLTAAEAHQYSWLAQREQELADMFNAGDNRPAVWAEAEQIASQMGYFVNASRIRNTTSGCQHGWY